MKLIITFIVHTNQFAFGVRCKPHIEIWMGPIQIMAGAISSKQDDTESSTIEVVK